MTTLAQAIIDPSYRRYELQVTMTLYVDNGRVGEPTYAVSLFLPRTVVPNTLEWSNPDYAIGIGSGHPLNPSGTGNRLDITIRNSTIDPSANTVIYNLPIDGAPYLSLDGQPYISALRAEGPDINRNNFPDPTPKNAFIGGGIEDGSDSGLRVDLHFGNELDFITADYPIGDRWLRQRVLAMDVNLVLPAGGIRSRPGYRQAHFS